jgi:cytochrome P450
MDAKDEETKDSMSDQQLRDEVMTLFMAGHETSANALTWIGYILTQNPEILEKLLKEIDTLLDGKPLTFSLLPEFTYTKQVIEEGLRMYPPAWIIGRESIKQDKLDDYDVPPNCTVALPIYIAHHDEAWWENPHVFLPERFSPENQKSLPRFAYFPFGGGPRLCVGSHFALMEMQIVLILMLRKFQLTNKNEIVPQPDPLITLRPHTPIFMEIQKR